MWITLRPLQGSSADSKRLQNPSKQPSASQQEGSLRFRGDAPRSWTLGILYNHRFLSSESPAASFFISRPVLCGHEEKVSDLRISRSVRRDPGGVSFHPLEPQGTVRLHRVTGDTDCKRVSLCPVTWAVSGRPGVREPPSSRRAAVLAGQVFSARHSRLPLAPFHRENLKLRETW